MDYDIWVGCTVCSLGNYVIWGGINGFFLVLESIVAPSKRLANNFLGALFWRAWTLSIVLLSWVFFRAKSLPDALYILGHLNISPPALKEAYTDGMGATQYEWLLIGLSCLCLFGVELWEEKKKSSVITLLGTSSPFMRRGFYFLVVVAILLFGVMDSESQFIYFQF